MVNRNLMRTFDPPAFFLAFLASLGFFSPVSPSSSGGSGTVNRYLHLGHSVFLPMSFNVSE